MAGLPGPKEGDFQLFEVHLVGGWSRILQGSVLRAVLVNLMGNPDDGMENTFTEFVGDAKLCRETEVLEGRVAIQQDHSKLQQWARGSSHELHQKNREDQLHAPPKTGTDSASKDLRVLLEQEVGPALSRHFNLNFSVCLWLSQCQGFLRLEYGQGVSRHKRDQAEK